VVVCATGSLVVAESAVYRSEDGVKVDAII